MASAVAVDNVIIRDLTPTVTILTVPFLRFGHLKFGMRTTIVKLPSGGLAVFSPIGFTPSIKSKLTALGNNVKYLIAPDIEHHLYLAPWAEAYPDAKLLGPAGMAEKKSTLKFATIFEKDGQSVDEEWDAAFDYVYVATHPTKELVFLDRASKSIILADFIFNLYSHEAFSATKNADKGILTKLFASMTNTKGEAKGQKRFLWYANSGARKEINVAAAKINTWDFERIIVAHGDVIDVAAKKVFSTVLAWHLKAAEEEAKSK